MPPIGHYRYGPKIGDCASLGRGAGSPSNTMWPGPRPTCKPSFILSRPTVWPQYANVTDRRGQTGKTGRRSDSIGRTVLQTVAQKPCHASLSSDYTVYLFLEQCLIIPRLSPYKTEANTYYADDHKSRERELTHRNCLHCGSRSRGATTFSKLGGPMPWSRLLYRTKYGWHTQFHALQAVT